MTVESASFISDLNSSYPAATDAKSEGDDHLRLIKSVLKNTFPNITGIETSGTSSSDFKVATTSQVQAAILASSGISAVLPGQAGNAGKYLTTNGTAASWATAGDVTLSGTQTLTNKTLTAPVISTISNTGTLSLPTSTDTLVGRATTDTLTNKTLEAATITNGYTEEVATANTGTTYTIDLNNGSVQVLTLTGNCVYTFPTATAGRSFLLIQKQDGTGSRTVTWPSVTNPVKWPSGLAPTITATASRADVFSFTADGTNWIGRTIAQNYTL